jgi:purine-binding chemotaxis protein CheW
MQHNFNSEKDSEQAVVKSEKYLTFNLSGEQYGLEILKVKEIIGLMEITRVPRIPDFVRGVINLRGKVIPIIDLRKKFEMESTEDTEHTCIIVVDIMQDNVSLQMGIVVDSVSEVLDISDDAIEETPTFGTSTSTVFIKGIAKTKGGVKILLNIEEVLTINELQSLAESSISES